MSKKIELVNMYNLIPAKYKPDKINYKNYNEMMIDLPARILVIGASGSGKSNLVLQLIKLFSCFTRIYLFSKDLDEPLYKFLRDIFASVEKKTKKTILYYSNDIDEIPRVSEFDKSECNLVIIDDMINEKNLKNSNIADIWTMGRKQNITSIFISQSFFKVDMRLRQNSNYIILKKITSVRDFQRITSEYNLSIDKHQLEKMYKACTRTITDFMMIDIQTNDPNLKYRKNFQGIQME